VIEGNHPDLTRVRSYSYPQIGAYTTKALAQVHNVFIEAM